ncbi:hypothetical protein M0R72_06160 [Candidatus Pacearchaeota archaeon]|jgi:hypothetical protein|nr:hypothetical protein [Candidatus Pacearchaeota archaeon]
MILKLNDAIPQIEGTPDECAEVIRQLNGGSVTVHLKLPRTNDDTKKHASVSIAPSPTTTGCAQSDPVPANVPAPTGRTPKIPHEEDEWIIEQRHGNSTVEQIRRALIEKGYADITKNDVNNRITQLRNKIDDTRPRREPFDADTFIKEQRAQNTTPIEIGIVLTRRTGAPWSTEKVMERIREMDAMPVS